MNSQDDVNQAEWENPENWTAGSNLFCVYFSRKDTRIWVPKKIPAMGSTLNLGQRGGVIWLTAFLVGIPAVIILITVLIAVCLKG